MHVVSVIVNRANTFVDQDSVIRSYNDICGSGFSDPYCMLGIVTSSAAESEATNSEADKSGTVGIKTAVDRIPARFIKTTSVKENTLSPVWNEKFCL